MGSGLDSFSFVLMGFLTILFVVDCFDLLDVLLVLLLLLRVVGKEVEEEECDLDKVFACCFMGCGGRL